MGPLSSRALGQLPSVPMTEDGTAQTPDYRNISSCEHSTINKNTKNRYTAGGHTKQSDKRNKQ